MINILVILGGLGNEGITNSVLLYLERINKDGLDIQLGVAGESDYHALKRAQKIGIPIYNLPGRNTSPILYFLKLYKLSREKNFDIIHVHGNSATLAVDMIACKLAGVPIRIAHSRNTSCTHFIMDKFMRPFFYLSYTDGFACGEAAGKWLFGNRDFVVIPNGKAIDRFSFNYDKRNKIREDFKVDNKIVLGHVGVFNRQKNHSFLIDVFNSLVKSGNDNYVLFLIGEDKGEKENVIKKIKQYNIEEKITILDFKPNIEDYLCAMDIMLFPSLYEGLPNVVIEWQMSGLQCLISDTITKECAVLKSVKYLPINNGVDNWVDEILKTRISDRNESKNIIKEKMADAGFDIDKNAEFLKKCYLNMYEKLGRENN